MAKNTIYLGAIDKPGRRGTIVEGLAVDAFLPGTLLKRTASGLETSDITATSFSSEPILAREKGAGEAQEVTDAYTIGDTAIAGYAESGDFFYARVATAQVLIKGSKLSSNADGTLKLATIPATVGATSEQILFVSEEALTTSGVTLVKVRRP